MAKAKLTDWTTQSGLLDLKDMARRGLTDKEISKSIGISRTTFYKWLKNSEAFSEAIKEGRQPVTVEVEDSFIKECLGYYTEEVTTIEHPDGGVTKKTTTKFVRPNAASQMFYLKMRAPERWSGEQEDDSLTKIDKLLEEMTAAAWAQVEIYDPEE